jgi:hypothetical protein
MKRLKSEIISYLAEKLDKSPATIRKDISILKGNYGSCTSNAVAQIYAKKYNLSVLNKLDAEDKSCLPNLQVNRPVVVQQKKIVPREKIQNFFDYDTANYFIKEHVNEVNRAYTKDCLTCANILLRKIVENLIIDILRKKYPSSSLQDKQTYFDTVKGRYLDFSVLLNNLYAKRTDFDDDCKTIIERLNQLAKKFKDDANDKAHSLYHIVKTKSELDNLDIRTVIELIKELEISVGLRRVKQ